MSPGTVPSPASHPAVGQKLLQKFLPWITKGSLAIADYGLISGSNFLLGVVLARWLAPEQYGAYALAFSIAILIAFLYQAILLEPLSVFSGTLFRDNLRGYLKTAVWIHWGIGLLVCLILFLAAAIAQFFGHSPLLASAFAGITVAAPFIMMHAFGRRTFYLTLTPGPAAFGSSFYFVLVMAGIFYVYHQQRLSAFAAFLVIGFASLISGIVMVVQLNYRLAPSTTRPSLRAAWGKHWEYGRWALGTCVVGWIPNYIYIPLISSFSGMAAAGELKALMNLSAPVLQTYAALSMLFLPYAARTQAAGGRVAAARLTRKLALLFVAGAIAYWMVVIPLRIPIFRLLYAGKYVESSYLLPLFALETIVWTASLGHAIVLRAMESPRSLFIANSAASVLALLVGIPATRIFGLPGVVWSMILANALYTAVTLLLHHGKLSRLKISEADLMQSAEAG
jgi:O-antigen/teichoic acid export membrane protein